MGFSAWKGLTAGKLSKSIEPNISIALKIEESPSSGA
jgi:hypothetical protein